MARLRTVAAIKQPDLPGFETRAPTARPVPNIGNLSDAFFALSRLTENNKYQYFMLCSPPLPGEDWVGDEISLTNFPAFLVSDLLAGNGLAEWSLLETFSQSCAPFRQNLNDSAGLAPDSVGTKKRGINDDWISDTISEHLSVGSVDCIPGVTIGPRRVFLALFSASPVGESVSADLALSFQHIQEQLTRLSDKRATSRKNVGLNLREAECLEWVAAGKTSNEVSMIVGLSEHTVNHYLISCCKKLDCVNRTQAVAKALRSGIIA